MYADSTVVTCQRASDNYCRSILITIIVVIHSTPVRNMPRSVREGKGERAEDDIVRDTTAFMSLLCRHKIFTVLTARKWPVPTFLPITDKPLLFCFQPFRCQLNLLVVQNAKRSFSWTRWKGHFVFRLCAFVLRLATDL